MRHSLLPNGVKPLWGIVIDPANPGRHVKMFDYGRAATADKWRDFSAVLLGKEPDSGAPGEPE